MTQPSLLDAVTEVIAHDNLVEKGVIVTGFVLLAEFTDDDGESCIYCDTLEGQRCHATLGLLAYGTAIESRRAANQAGDDHDP